VFSCAYKALILGDDRHRGGIKMIKILNGIPILCDEISCTKKANLDGLLELGARLGVLINTHSMRGIGKTTALIEFAKKNDYLVVHLNASILSKEFNYKKIWNPNVLVSTNHQGMTNKNIVIDEGVTNLQELKDAGFNIITGFYTSITNEEKSFDETIIDNLKNELVSLTTKIQKTRENHDFGTYKNLILAYKEVLGLYKECVNNKQDILNYHVHIDKVISSTEDIGRQIGESLKSIKNNIEFR
jgi:hypothetical protein